MTARLMKKSEAAAYCRISTEQFSNWVRDGILPASIPGTHRWDRVAIDAKLDKIAGIASNSRSALEEWKATRNARHA